MAHYKVEESSLTMVADAIRERGETNGPLVFPEGFKSAVESIPDYMDLFVSVQLTEYRNTTSELIQEYAFYNCRKLKKVEFTNAWTTGYSTFFGCSALETANFPNAWEMSGYAFAKCSSLKRFDSPLLRLIGDSALRKSGIETLIIRKTDGLCTLYNTDTLVDTPIANGTGYIYVPRALVDSYKAASNWSNFSSQIRAIEDYPDIVGGAV
jgi:hypothetical protein